MNDYEFITFFDFQCSNILHPYRLVVQYHILHGGSFIGKTPDAQHCYAS